MKALIVIAGVALATILSANVMAQEANEEIKTIEKKITITDDGKRIIETTIDGETTVDTLAITGRRGPRKVRMEMINDDFPISWGEAQKMDFDLEIDGDSSNVFVIKHLGGFEEYRFTGATGFGKKHNVHVRDLRGDFRSSGRPMLDIHNKRLIDLNDPRITSFERETLKDGSEKITIIRKAPKKKGNKK